MLYEKLLLEANQLGVDIYEQTMSSSIKGLYSDNIVWINKHIPTSAEKACILAEELGHYHTSYGDILDQTNVVNRKQESLARFWAYEQLVPLSRIISAYNAGVRNRYELAEYIGITEDFLENALQRYKDKYGLYTTKDGYTIYFEPLGVLAVF